MIWVPTVKIEPKGDLRRHMKTIKLIFVSRTTITPTRQPQQAGIVLT
jgi:hypothetical protein